MKGDFYGQGNKSKANRGARFFLGAATAAIMSASVALITVFFNGEKQLRIIAIQGMSMELGGVIFLSISGVLAGFSWQYPFFIYALGFAALIMLLLFVPKCGKADESMEETKLSLQQQGVPVSLVLLTAFFVYFLSGHAAALVSAVLFAGAGFGLSTPLFNSLVVRKSTPEKKAQT